MEYQSRFLAAADEDLDSVEYLAELQFIALAEKICVAMEMRGLTKSGLARAMGVRESYVTKLLSGAENLTLLTMTKVSKALGVNLTVDLQGYPDASVFTTRTAPSVSVKAGGKVEHAVAA